jgi:anti-anti-sigma factor
MLSLSSVEGARGFQLAGELDMSTARQLAEHLDPELAQGGDIILDVRALTFMDSTGLQVLIRSALTLGDRGRLILRSPGVIVRSILQMAMRSDKLANLVVEDG